MSPNAQRIAIAEACGWKPITFPKQAPEGIDVSGWKHPTENFGVFHDDLPNYLTDLNAMHEAEKAAFDGHADLWHAYLDRELPPLCERADNPIECATATQRAEAFLRTLNLWDDSK